MRFYTQQHAYYCGVDLHTKMMYLCIISQDGEIVLHRNLNTDAKAFLAAVAPYRDGLVVGVECIFCWYWPIARAIHLAPHAQEAPAGAVD